jgi:hypothetical protein
MRNTFAVCSICHPSRSFRMTRLGDERLRADARITSQYSSPHPTPLSIFRVKVTYRSLSLDPHRVGGEGTNCTPATKRDSICLMALPLTLPSPPLFPLRGAVERERKCEVIFASAPSFALFG